MSERLLCIKVILPPLFDVVDPPEPPSVLHDNGVTVGGGGKVNGVNRFKWLLTSERWPELVPSRLFGTPAVPEFMLEPPPFPFKIKRPPPVCICDKDNTRDGWFS